MEVDVSDEDYVIQRARNSFANNDLSARAWMLTAKTLYPNNFGVQFEAYLIEKRTRQVKEAAKCFSELITKFQQEAELWKEIEKITAALRSENDQEDEVAFLCEMFRHISSDVQHKLLLFTADHCEDTMEHCKLLLLLLQRFPTAVASYGPRLLDTLIAAEKHSPDGHFPANQYRKMLVCDLLPLLNQDHIKMKLSSKVLYVLIFKTVEYYLSYLGIPSGNNLQENENKENLWEKIFDALAFIGRQLNWKSYLIDFKETWDKEIYWQCLVKFSQSSYVVNDEKQLFYCLNIFFIYCLYDYYNCLAPEPGPGQLISNFVLVEAFNDATVLNLNEPKSKKRKSDADNNAPLITLEKAEQKNLQSNFLMCVNCLEMLQYSDSLRAEFNRFMTNLKLEHWLNDFVIDYSIFKGKYDDTLINLDKIHDPADFLLKHIRIANLRYQKKFFMSCLDTITKAIPYLPQVPGSLCNNLVTGGPQRHLHYLPVTRKAILQYFVKLLLRCIKENMAAHNFADLAIGHVITLIQLDWPQEEEFLPPLLDRIQQNRSFVYHLFQNYIVNAVILEELSYLWSHSGNIHFEILPHMSQRRIGTRGADKGAKEEIKQAFRRQICRSNENIDELIANFLVHERALINQILV